MQAMQLTDKIYSGTLLRLSFETDMSFAEVAALASCNGYLILEDNGDWNWMPERQFLRRYTFVDKEEEDFVEIVPI